MTPNSIDIEYIDAILQDIEDAVTLADSSFWIPFVSVSERTEWEIEKIEFEHNDYTQFIFNARPSVLTLRVSLIKILISGNLVESIQFINALFSGKALSFRKNSFACLMCELTALKNFMSKHHHSDTNPYNISRFSFLTRLDTLQQVLAAELVNIRLPPVLVPRWLGKPMEFIEFISIGIELGLLEGENQNQICNRLIKAFQVDAEDEMPIYKQRFDAMFRRSKKQLPLLSAYVQLVEAKKGLKISDFNDL